MDNTAEHSLSDEEWSDVEEEEKMPDSGNALCLFCDETFGHAGSAIEHMKEMHHFNVTKFCKERNLDFYGYVKVINYIRMHKLDSLSILKVDVLCFDDDKYFRPVQEDDALLQIDFDARMN